MGDIAKAVMTSSGARIESTTSMTSGTTTFLISGKPEAVAKARRDLRSSFAKKVIDAQINFMGDLFTSVKLVGLIVGPKKGSGWGS